MADDGRRVTDDLEKANLLCGLFQSTYIDTQTPPPLTAALYPPEVRRVDVLDIDVSEYGVYSQLIALESKLSTSPEGLPAHFFKHAAVGLALPLSLIYTESLSTGELPSIYSEALICPVHKKGKRDDPRNKRPVSLTAVSREAAR